MAAFGTVYSKSDFEEISNAHTSKEGKTSSALTTLPPKDGHQNEAGFVKDTSEGFISTSKTRTFHLPFIPKTTKSNLRKLLKNTG